MSTEQTRRRISAALDLIDTAADRITARMATAYATGYIDALADERRLDEDEAQLYREEPPSRRQERFARLDAES